MPDSVIYSYHDMRVDGLMLKGASPVYQRLVDCQFPARLDGQRVLDVGAWDGFFSFEAERRGAAEVVAIDTVAWRMGKPMFDAVHRQLGSKVWAIYRSVLDLSPEMDGMFDTVLLLQVLYHMEHPLMALEKAAAVCRGFMLIETLVVESELSCVYANPVESYGNWDITMRENRCWPQLVSRVWLEDALRWLGFSAEVVYNYPELDHSRGVPGRRTVYHCYRRPPNRFLPIAKGSTVQIELNADFVIKEITTLGYRMSVPMNLTGNCYIQAGDAFESHVVEPMERVLKECGEHPKLLDVGANFGFYSLMMNRKLGGRGSVIAVEPNAWNLELLYWNLRQNGITNTIVLSVGASESFKLSGYGGGFANSVGQPKEAQEPNCIALAPLDQLLTGWQPDVVKIDVEGSEVGVINGARRILGNCRSLFIEYFPEMLRNSGSDPAQFLALLRELNFDKVTQIRDGWLVETQADWDRLLAVPICDLHLERLCKSK